jgi:hypothetical protein
VGFQTVRYTSANKDSAQSALCVVSNKEAINTNCNAHNTADKIQVWQPQCRAKHELRTCSSHTSALYRRGFALDRQRTTGTHKRCRRQGSKRRTRNLPYLDWRGGGYIFRLLGIFIVIPAHWIPTLTPPTDIGTNTATLRCW